jgi:hypothetical protein
MVAGSLFRVDKMGRQTCLDTGVPDRDSAVCLLSGLHAFLAGHQGSSHSPNESAPVGRDCVSVLAVVAFIGCLRQQRLLFAAEAVITIPLRESPRSSVVG